MPDTRQTCSRARSDGKPPSAINTFDCAAVASRVAALLMAALLAACAPLSAPPSNASLTLPAAWSEAVAPSNQAQPVTALARWWLRFDDPLLSALIDDALSANPTVRSAVAALAQSRAMAAVQSAGLGPNVRASASVQRSVSGKDSASASNLFRAGFDASWEPDIFGGQHAAVSAANAEVLASVASLGDVQISVAAEVALDYMQLRGLQTRLEIARANLAAQMESLQLTQWRTQAGLVTSLELEQARGAVEQTRAQIPSLQAAATQTEHGIAVLTGKPPAALHERLMQPAHNLAAPDELVLDIPARTLRQRPDLRAAEARVSAAAARVTQADAARLPNFQLSGSLGLNALTLGSLANTASLVKSLLASASATLFDGGAASAQVRAQMAALEQARASFDATLLAALQDVEDSLVALKGDRERQQSLRMAAEAAQNAALLAGYRYAGGLTDFQILLDTQRNALNTQDSLASTLAAVNADHVRLYKALGGGWEAQDENATRTSPTPP